MPRSKTTRKCEISHSIIIDKYRTNDGNKDEISILDHSNKSFCNLRLTREKMKGKLAKSKIQCTRPKDKLAKNKIQCTRPKENKAGSVVENSLDSKQYCLRNRFSSTEIVIANKSPSTQFRIKSNQCSSSSDTTKKDVPSKTYRKNDNVSDELDKKKRSRRKKLVSTSNKDSTSKMCKESQKQIKVVSSRSEIVPDRVGESKTNGVDISRGQNRIKKGNVKSSGVIVPSDLKRKMNPYVDMSKSQLNVQRVEVQRSQRIVKRNFKKTEDDEPFSTNCQGNYDRCPSRDKNQGTTSKTFLCSEGNTIGIPPKNVNKRQKMDSSDKVILKSDAKQKKAALSYIKRSFNRIVTNAGKRSDVDTESNSGIQQHQCLKLSYADYISIAQRILKKNGESLAA